MAQVLHRATVTRVQASGVFVEIPKLGIGVEFGPCEKPNFYLSVGDRVLVGMVEGINEDLVIINILQYGNDANLFPDVDVSQILTGPNSMQYNDVTYFAGLSGEQQGFRRNRVATVKFTVTRLGPFSGDDIPPHGVVNQRVATLAPGWLPKMKVPIIVQSNANDYFGSYMLCSFSLNESGAVIFERVFTHEFDHFNFIDGFDLIASYYVEK